MEERLFTHTYKVTLLRPKFKGKPHPLGSLISSDIDKFVNVANKVNAKEYSYELMEVDPRNYTYEFSAIQPYGEMTSTMNWLSDYFPSTAKITGHVWPGY